MSPFFAIDYRGTTRLAVCIGPVAIKFPRRADGRRYNREEARRWKVARMENRPKLCPVLFAVPCGLALVMQRATPLNENEARDSIPYDAFICTGATPRRWKLRSRRSALRGIAGRRRVERVRRGA